MRTVTQQLFVNKHQEVVVRSCREAFETTDDVSHIRTVRQEKMIRVQASVDDQRFFYQWLRHVRIETTISSVHDTLSQVTIKVKYRIDQPYLFSAIHHAVLVRPMLRYVLRTWGGAFRRRVEKWG